MPTYEYKCSKCEKVFEEIQKITEPAIEVCVYCGAKEAKRQISATAFHLKGTGWYKTDYGSGGNSPSPSTTDSAPTDKAPATETKTTTETKPVEKKEAPAPATSTPKAD